MTAISVTDADREAAKRFVYDYNVRDIFQSREGPIEDLTDIIARARAEERERVDREWCIAIIPEGPDAVQHITERLNGARDAAIRARGEKGKD